MNQLMFSTEGVAGLAETVHFMSKLAMEILVNQRNIKHVNINTSISYDLIQFYEMYIESAWRFINAQK